MYPEAFEKNMKMLLGEEFPRFREALSLPPVKSLRVNSLKMSSEDFFESRLFETERVPWDKNGFYFPAGFHPASHPFHRAGAYYIQEASAMAVAVAADIHPGMKVLDLCAAPGGKSRRAATFLKETGILVSNEINSDRCKVLSGNIERMGVKNCIVTNRHPEDIRQKFPRYFDRVLVDAPCSGEGLFRREPKACSRWSPDLPASCASRQKKIMDSARRTVAPGGKLIYSTCTFEKRENEDVAEYFLSRHPDFSPADTGLSRHFPPGVGKKERENYPGDKFLRLYPHRVKGEGHFVAVFEKTGGNVAKFRKMPRHFDKGTAVLGENFARDVLACPLMPPGYRYFSEKDCLWAIPEDTPDFQGLRTLRMGLFLGNERKGRFLPSHSLALSLKNFQAADRVNFSPEDERLREYMYGLEIPDPDGTKGYRLICVGGLGLGWGKSDGRVIKNHYPKGLRLKKPDYDIL